MTKLELFKIAESMLKRSYAPFSNFHVGAALLGKDGKVYTGCNIENSSLGATICAERTAMTKAISEGCTEFEAIAIAASDGEAWPCGICRQFMREFTEPKEFLVYVGADEDHIRTHTLEELLPESFKL